MHTNPHDHPALVDEPSLNALLDHEPISSRRAFTGEILCKAGEQALRSQMAAMGQNRSNTGRPNHARCWGKRKFEARRTGAGGTPDQVSAASIGTFLAKDRLLHCSILMSSRPTKFRDTASRLPSNRVYRSSRRTRPIYRPIILAARVPPHHQVVKPLCSPWRWRLGCRRQCGPRRRPLPNIPAGKP